MNDAERRAIERAIDLYSSRLWSREKAMAMVGADGPEYIAGRPADVDDWPPDLRPEPEDLEAARLLGVDPRPPVREAAPMRDGTAYWDEMPVLHAGNTQAMAQMLKALEDLKQEMAKNGAPQPQYVMVHPNDARLVKEMFEK